MEKFLGVILGLALVGLCIYGWTWLLTLAVNYILASFGMKPVGMLLVFCCQFVLGTFASYFKRTQVKGMNKLLFLDCETTGLDPNTDMLLEVGMVVVDLPAFDIVAEQSNVFHFELKPTLTKDHHFKGPGRDLFIHRKVVDMHKGNGLWDACKRSQLVDYQKLDDLLRQFIVDNGCDGSVLAGANPSFDRDFLKKFCPTTARGLHYRNFDTNTFWLLQGFITGEDMRREKPATHRAVDDCKDAIGVVEKHFDFFQKLCGVV